MAQPEMRFKCGRCEAAAPAGQRKETLTGAAPVIRLRAVARPACEQEHVAALGIGQPVVDGVEHPLTTDEVARACLHQPGGRIGVEGQGGQCGNSSICFHVSNTMEIWKQMQAPFIA